MTAMTFDEWFDTYKPVTNEHGELRLFETYGVDLQIVARTDNQYVWTWYDSSEYSSICNGYGYVNRLGYYLCEVPWKEGESLEIDISDGYTCEDHIWIEYENYQGQTIVICQECEVQCND
jgi:hypothetical protein